MARKRVEPPTTVIMSWAELDEALRKVALADLDIEKIEYGRDRKIVELKADAAAKIAKKQDEITDLAEAMRVFCEAHRDEFGEKKTMARALAEVGWRESTSIKPTKKVTAATLYECGLDDYLKIEPKCNLMAMRKLSNVCLELCGAKRVTADTFGYEMDWTKVAEVAV